MSLENETVQMYFPFKEKPGGRSPFDDPTVTFKDGVATVPRFARDLQNLLVCHYAGSFDPPAAPSKKAEAPAK